VLENSYLRELHASHHCNEQTWLSQQKQVVVAATPTYLQKKKTVLLKNAIMVLLRKVWESNGVRIQLRKIL
jgi:hypothetical protein